VVRPDVERDPEGLAVLVRTHDFVLRRAFEDGRRTYGDLPLLFERFAARFLALTCRRLFASGVARNEANVGRVLRRVAGADLFLGVACDEGVSGAWEALAEHYLPRVRGLAIRHGASPGDAEEIVQDLPGALACPPPDGAARTRIGTYDGTGNLFCWLAVIVLRRLADRGRDAARATPTNFDDSALLAAKGDNPAALVLNADLAAKLRTVLEAAWPRLTRQESLALLWKYRDGLKQEAIAGLFGVHKSRVSRIVTAGVDKLRAAITAGLAADLPAAPSGRLWRALGHAVETHMATLAPMRDQLMGNRPDG